MGKGRKIFDGKGEAFILQKLEQVWGIGGSDAEAAFYAEISPAALSDYLKKHPAITERKEALKNKPILKARQEVVKGLENNPEFSLKYLERKISKEFALRTKHELTGEGGEELSININLKEKDTDKNKKCQSEK